MTQQMDHNDERKDLIRSPIELLAEFDSTTGSSSLGEFYERLYTIEIQPSHYSNLILYGNSQ